MDNDSLRTDSEYILPSVCNLAVRANPCLPLMRVRVSGGHLCEAEAPTEAAAETEGEKRLEVRTVYRLLSKLPLPQSNVYSLKSKV